MDFQHTYPFDAINSMADELYPGYSRFLTSRKGRIPVLLDPNFGMVMPSVPGQRMKSLILRLDGTVSVVEHNPVDLTDVLTK